MYHPKYAMFFDNHTHSANPDVGKTFDAEAFTDQLKRCNVDFLGFHARCNQGFAYYNTKIGTRHPSLTHDLFGELAENCRRKGIKLTAYLNGGISHEEWIQHREWGTVNFEGRSIGEDRVNPFARTMCYNSPFRDHIMAMIRELAENYPVDGFFIDCMVAFRCICPTCVRMMHEQGFDPTNAEDVKTFSYQSALRMCRDIAALARTLLPEPFLFFNSSGIEDHRDADSYFECECLPTSPLWGYEFLPTMAHYLRNIRPGTPVLNMTGRFLDWGDFGSLRPAESLMFDVLYGMANGMRPNIAGHIHPRGDLDLPVFDRVHEVYNRVQKFDAWFENTENQTEVAVLYSGKELEMAGSQEMRAIVRMLDEMKYQFDIVLPEPLHKKYSLLIVPGEAPLTPQGIEIVKKHLAEGGALFSCGSHPAKQFGDLIGVEWKENCEFDPAYFRLKKKSMNPDLPDMPLTAYSSVVSVKPCDDAEVLASIVKPYYSKGWNGLDAIFYIPPQEETDLPFAVRYGKSVYCAGNLFTGSFTSGASHLRAFLKECLDEILPNPLIRTKGMPSFTRIYSSVQSQRRVVTVLSYAPEKRGNAIIVEEGAGVIGGEVSLRLDGMTVNSIRMAPENVNLEFKIDGDYVRVKLPPFTGYLIFSVE